MHKNTQSLQEIMNRLAHQPEEICAAATNPLKILDEMSAFIQLDETLADMNKQYLDAKAHRKNLVRLHGRNDAMTEIAYDMEDSAYCALQTRYIEVRQCRELMTEAQRLMRQSETLEKARIEKDKLEKRDAFLINLKIYQRLRARRREENIIFFEVAILLLIYKVPPFALPQFKNNFMQQAMAA